MGRVVSDGVWGHTTTVKVDMNRPRPWTGGLIDAHWNQVAIVAWDLCIVDLCRFRSWACAI